MLSLAAPSVITSDNAFDTAIRHSAAEQKVIQQLKARDLEVRAHEAAHIAAGAGLVKGGASFSFEIGPDGIQYAIGGEVNIDTSKVAGNPHATIEKAQRIQAAALAPASPSSQDRAVASQAAQMAVEAKAELSQTSSSTQNNLNKQYGTTGQSFNPTGNQIDIHI